MHVRRHSFRRRTYEMQILCGACYNKKMQAMHFHAAKYGTFGPHDFNVCKLNTVRNKFSFWEEAHNDSAVFEINQPETNRMLNGGYLIVYRSRRGTPAHKTVSKTINPIAKLSRRLEQKTRSSRYLLIYCRLCQQSHGQNAINTKFKRNESMTPFTHWFNFSFSCRWFFPHSVQFGGHFLRQMHRNNWTNCILRLNQTVQNIWHWHLYRWLKRCNSAAVAANAMNIFLCCRHTHCLHDDDIIILNQYIT